MSAYSTRRKNFGERRVNQHATTWDATKSLVSALEPFTAKAVAKKAGTNTRTAENWKSGLNGPSWSHFTRMMHDPELGPAMLMAIGRADLADAVEVLAKLRAAQSALNEIAP